ncbi:MAG: FAD-dependent oxidoreductase [Acidobacteriota bacterium]
MSGEDRKRIAIVGAGISGLVTAHLLHRRYDVTVFEAASHIGGHTYTVPVADGDRELAVDMGFIVYNDRTYPNFIRLLDELGVATEASDMSFSVSCGRTGLEYCGSSLDQLFAQRRNLVRFSFYRMLVGILRFHKRAPRLLQADPRLSLGEYLDQERYSRPFVDHYLIPMISAIWSTEPQRMLEFPVRTLASFLDNHGMLTVSDRPQWRVVTGGSSSYVGRLTAPLDGRIHAGTPVERVRRDPGGVDVKLKDGETARFDAVVFAAHSDQALALLDDPTPAEREVLGAIPYQMNDVVLHTDRSLLPRRQRAWASWNYHLDPAEAQGTQVTYYMNRLQNLESSEHYCVTLNRTEAIDPARILHRKRFAHPLFTAASTDAKARWHDVSTDRTFYCGAYWGFGFHEDGVKSGIRVAETLGAGA